MTPNKRPRVPQTAHQERTRYLAVRLPVSLADALDHRAEVLGVGRSAAVRMLLSLALDRQESHR